MFYPPLLTSGDLLHLLEWTGLALQGPRRTALVPFCNWLRGFAVAEMDRRQAAEPIETAMPVLPLDKLTPETIAHANMSLHCVAQETESHRIGELAAALLDVVTAANLAHARTRKDAHVNSSAIDQPNS